MNTKICFTFALVSLWSALGAASVQAQPAPVPQPAENDPFVQRVAELYKAGDFAQVQKLLEAELADEKNPTEQVAWRQLLGKLQFNWAQQRATAGDWAGAIEHYQKARATDATLRPSVGALEAANIADAYGHLNRDDEALKFYALALATYRQLHDSANEGVMLNNMGLTYDKLSRSEEAIASFQLALPLYREAKDVQGEAKALSNMGLALENLSRYDEALHSYELALLIYLQTQDRHGEATVRSNLGWTYMSLGRYEEALQSYQVALPLFRALQDHASEAVNLMQTGAVYFELKRYEESLRVCNLALPFFREAKDIRREAQTLTVMGGVYWRMSRYDEALRLLQLIVPLEHQLDDPQGEGSTLYNIGKIYQSLDRYDEAAHYFNLALPIERRIHDRAGESWVLSDLMVNSIIQGHLDAGVVYGKQALNVIQLLRRDLQHLDKPSQRAFLATHRDYYEMFAALLTKQNHLEEAEQVLRFLRLEDAFEFVQRDPQLAQGLEALLRPLSFSSDEMKQLPEGSDATEGEGAPESRLWQAALQQREKEGAGRAALISTFNTDDSFYVLLTTPKGRRAFAVSIERSDFDALCARLQSELSDKDLDPRPDAQLMEQIVFCNGQLERALQDEHIDVALWFASGSLRSIPIDALWDGQHYLVEYPRANVNVTLTSRQLFEAKSQGGALAAGVSRGYSVKSSTPAETLEFPALPNVPIEVRAIVHDQQHDGVGPLDGQILLNDDFSATNLQHALELGVGTVHLATHFALGRAGDASSFLLLGEGQTLPMSQWKDTLKLKGVGLLTLSACQTGVGSDRVAGAEVSSIGEISQWLGAQSVLVSLWPVNDASTARLMGDFYHRWHDAPAQGKIEALRQAQRAMLGITTALSSDEKRGQPLREDDGKNAPTFVKDPQHPFAHPFYWAPFTLIGNWK